MEEERRLFYVAMTRAMIKLYITFAQGRMLFGQVKFNGPSRFIDEIPEKLYSWKKLKGHQEDRFDRSSSGGYGQKTFDPYDQSQSSHYDNEEVIYQIKERESFHQPKFPKGALVTHSLYGAGKVEDSEGSGADEKVTIMFIGGSKKKFMVKFAPIVMA